MLNRWWCMDCRSTVNLDRHGRCGSCESEAVDPFRPGTRDASSLPMAEIASTDSVSCG